MSDATVIDLFAGPGGWSQGLASLGLAELGIDNHRATCETAEAAGHQRVLADLHDTDTAMGHGMQGLIASPPCPGFSKAGKGLGRLDLTLLLGCIDKVAMGGSPAEAIEHARFAQHDPRSALTLEPLRWIIDVEPEWVALEQVVQVLPLWEAYAHVLRMDGYSVWTGKLKAEQYGVPQTRTRAILMARRGKDVVPPVPTHSAYYSHAPTKLDAGVQKWVSMADALTWGTTERPYPTIACSSPTGGPDMEKVGGSGARAIIYRERDAGRWQLATPLHNRAYDRSIPRTLDKPAPTMTFGHAAAEWQWQPTFVDQSGAPYDPDWPSKRPATTVAGRDLIGNPGGNANRFNGRTKSRNDGVRVTVEEAGVLQSFPADYPWQGNSSERFRQVGNAVPPLLAQAVLGVLTDRQLRIVA